MSVPALHRRFLEGVLPRIERDPRMVGVAVGGSIAHGAPDRYSDVDLVLAVRDDDFDAVMGERMTLISSWVPLVAGFTGEHVGEPRLIIALVEPGPLHVDFAFVRLSDFTARTDELHVLWERGSGLAEALITSAPREPELDLQWIEDRFWIWIHYGAAKLARGELFEAIGFIAYLRETVFGPLIQHRRGYAVQGVRRIETIDPGAAVELEATLCGHDRGEIGTALLACVDLYRRWTSDAGVAVERNTHAERVAVRFLDEAVAESRGSRRHVFFPALP